MKRIRTLFVIDELDIGGTEQQIVELVRGIDRTQGAIVVVRPDQYVSNVLPLHAHDELAAFFGRFLLEGNTP